MCPFVPATSQIDLKWNSVKIHHFWNNSFPIKCKYHPKYFIFIKLMKYLLILRTIFIISIEFETENAFNLLSRLQSTNGCVIRIKKIEKTLFSFETTNTLLLHWKTKFLTFSTCYDQVDQVQNRKIKFFLIWPNQ